MKRILSFLTFIFLFLNSVAVAEELKFAVLTDVHIRLNKQDTKYLMTQSIKNLQNAISIINQSNVDFVVFLGDNVDQANKESVVMFSKIIKDLKKPYYVLIGNHDVAEVTGVNKKEYYHYLNKFSKNKIKKVPTKFQKKGIIFIVMDGVNQFIPSAKGNYKENELIFLEKNLEKYKDKKVVILQHFPLIEPRPHKTHETVNTDEYFEILNKYNNVIAVLSGHYHTDNEQKVDGINHISVTTLQDKFFDEVIIEKENQECFIRVKVIEIE